MTRGSPPELERAFPGPQEPTSVTSAPRPRRCRAVQPPKAPAPTTATRGRVAPAKSGCTPRRAASGSAAAIPMKVRRETPPMDSDDIASSAVTSGESVPISEVDTRRDADRPGLVGQEADPGAGSALLVEGQQRRLVGHVVDEDRRVPAVLEDADPEVDDVVRRQFRIEGEGVLRVRAADVVRCKGGQTDSA